MTLHKLDRKRLLIEGCMGVIILNAYNATLVVLFCPAHCLKQGLFEIRWTCYSYTQTDRHYGNGGQLKAGQSNREGIQRSEVFQNLSPIFCLPPLLALLNRGMTGFCGALIALTLNPSPQGANVYTQIDTVGV